MKRLLVFILLIPIFTSFLGCAVSITHRVSYPASDELFVTLGDDPGSESNKSYIPKGQFIHVEQEAYIPLPLFGIFAKIGNAEPQYVFDTHVIPKVRQMGGDALIGAHVEYSPPGPWWLGLLGLRTGGQTIIRGQVVKR